MNASHLSTEIMGILQLVIVILAATKRSW